VSSILNLTNSSKFPHWLSLEQAPQCLPFRQRPLTLTAFASPIGSVDGHTLQIDELKGTKPAEKIDLWGKGLSVASAIIIASCIKGNGVLKELECAAPEQICFLVRAY
jgi:hypothetical protein